MTSIDLDQLAHVTGGRGCGAQPQAEQQPDGAPDASAPQSGNLVSGIDQFLSLFQSDGFQQVVGGLRQLLGSFGSAGAQPADGQ